MDILGLSDLPFLPSIVTRADVPDDLARVQTIDSRAEVAPFDVGLEPDATDRIWASALRWYRSGIHPAISVCIRVRGQVILRRSIGWSHGGGPGEPDEIPKVKVTPETPFNVFSASKPMPAMIIHLLDQRHLLHLDDPVCEYIPEFCQHGKEFVTIRHVLTHRAGVPTIPDTALDLSLLEDIDNREAIKLLCDARPVSRAGGRLAYHAITGGFILGEIVRRVTGKNIRTVVDEELCKPMGWRWMNFGVRRRDLDKVAKSYFTGLPLVPPVGAIARNVLGLDFVEAVELSNDPRYLMGVLPSANLIATADELCEFYQLLLSGGTLHGKQVFEPRTVWRATAEQSYGEIDFTFGIPVRYGMGFMLGGEYLSLYGFGSQHAFGHLGLTNIVAWADPERQLSVAVMTSGKPVLYPEMHRALGLMYTIAAACPKDEAVESRPWREPEPPVKRKKRVASKSKRAAPKSAASKSAASKSAASKSKPAGSKSRPPVPKSKPPVPKSAAPKSKRPRKKATAASAAALAKKPARKAARPAPAAKKKKARR